MNEISKENLERLEKIADEKTKQYNILVSVKYGIRDESEVDIVAFDNTYYEEGDG